MGSFKYTYLFNFDIVMSYIEIIDFVFAYFYINYKL